MRREEERCTRMMRKRSGRNWHVRHAVTRMASLMIACQKAVHERDQALTALDDAYMELERLHAFKSDVIAMMNNEFRSALFAIQSACETIRDNDLDSADVREFALDIHADAQYLLRMIADQLETGSSAAGSKTLHLEWLNLNAIIAGVVNRLRSIAYQPIRLQLARALPILLGDREQLRYVISHLLKTSIQCSPADGEIRVSSVVDGRMVHVCMRNQGLRVPAFALEEVYADGACPNTEKLIGPLQAMPSVREIVLMHEGEIWVENELITGSTIHFAIPFTHHRRSI